jgi:hypothetical protein
MKSRSFTGAAFFTIMKKKWIFSLIGFVLATAIMQWQGASLKNAAAPGGILALEFARNSESLHALLLSWKSSDVWTNILLDFIYIPAYTFFFVASLRLAKAANYTIVMASLAALFDLAENSLMLLSLAGHYSAYSLQTTALLAGLKFFCLGYCAAVIIAKLLISAWSYLRG